MLNNSRTPIAATSCGEFDLSDTPLESVLNSSSLLRNCSQLELPVIHAQNANNSCDCDWMVGKDRFGLQQSLTKETRSIAYANGSDAFEKDANTYHFGDEPFIDNVHLFHIRQELNPKYESEQSNGGAIQKSTSGSSFSSNDDVSSRSAMALETKPDTRKTQCGRVAIKKVGEYKRAWQRPPTAVAKRNARERTRVHTVNQAFVVLKYHLPSVRSNAKRVSKLKILKAAINYIYALTDMLQAFVVLKYHLPSVRSNAKRVSKLKILKAAINYIYALTDMLQDYPPQPIPGPTQNCVRNGKMNQSKITCQSYRNKGLSNATQSFGASMLSTIPSSNAYMGSILSETLPTIPSRHNMQQIVDTLYTNPSYLTSHYF
ncbi:Helix-loop-helix protein 4 [Toxocara canis]|uniref:Helix-loop-helix protein 4 n=1 Tax=Toxocara canis TaxID=6265 RepID=A0A0B2W0I4_TOXCA|nr:Helix-loop-helix protein 4 [Toxocara canis]